MGPEHYSRTERAIGKLRRRLWLERLFFLALLGLGLAYHYGALPGGRGAWLIAADGRPVVVVKSHADAVRLLEDVKQTTGPPERVKFEQKVSFHRVPAERNPVQSDADAIAALMAQLRPLIEGAAVLADGELVVGLPTKEEASKTLSLLLKEFSPPGEGVTRVFKENVQVELQDLPTDKFAESAQAAVAKIRKELAPAGVHEVKPGETAWEIARDYRVPLGRFAQANPDLDINRLRAGDEVNIPSKGAPITVVARREVRETTGRGPRGRLQIVRITYENGVEVSRQVIGRRTPRVPGSPPGSPVSDRGPAASRRGRSASP